MIVAGRERALARCPATAWLVLRTREPLSTAARRCRQERAGNEAAPWSTTADPGCIGLGHGRAIGRLARVRHIPPFGNRTLGRMHIGSQVLPLRFGWCACILKGRLREPSACHTGSETGNRYQGYCA